MKSMKAYRRMLGAVGMTYSNPILVSVGVNDGITAERVVPFCLSNRWKSILIEPLPHIIKKCKKNIEKYIKNNNNIYMVQCAASDFKGSISMRYVDDSIPLNDYDKAHRMGMASASEDYSYDEYIKPYIRSIEVPCRRLDDIINEKVDHVTVVSIDVEGYEDRVFAGFDVGRWKPKVIIWEKKHLSKTKKRSIMRRLTALGYRHAEFGPDCISAVDGLEKLIDGA